MKSKIKRSDVLETSQHMVLNISEEGLKDITHQSPPEYLGRFQDLDPDKLRGGYYTPPSIAKWLSEWAIRLPTDTFIEPSCGDGSILLQGVQRLLDLGTDKNKIVNQIQGVEITADEVKKTLNKLDTVLEKSGLNPIHTGDFFQWFENNSFNRYNVVIGNPPFLRYQIFPEPSRSIAMLIMKKFGLHPNKLTNIWVPFVVAATELLHTGGRLAFVIPAELLQVSYASQIRTYLTEQFKHISIVSCNELFFLGAEQEVVLLLAEDRLPKSTKTNHCCFSIVEASSVNSIISNNPAQLLSLAEEKEIFPGEKWLGMFLSKSEIELFREVQKHEEIVELSKYASVDVGIVTGNNSFFVVSKSKAKQSGLDLTTVPLLGRTSQFKGAIMDKEDWIELSNSDELVHLFNPQPYHDLIPSVKSYIGSGEVDEVHKGYKCSIRKPWFRLAGLWTPDAFLFRHIYDFPRLVHNQTLATSTDTIHRVSIKNCEPSLLVAASYTYLTAASAELVGRSYGGGVLNLEPSEGDKLLIPNTLDAGLPLVEIDRLVRSGNLITVLEENSRLVLQGSLGLSKQDAERLKTIWDKMRNRRSNRKKKISSE